VARSPETTREYEGKPVLVTGAGGFIGSHLVEGLVEAGARVRAMVRYSSTGSWGFLDSSAARDAIEIIAGDVRDADCVARAVAGQEVIFHLAALIGIPYSYESPTAYVRTNIEGTLNVLEAARASGAARIVHTSTSEVYGTAQRVPIDEEHPLVGQSPYSATKIAADKMAEASWRSFDLPVVTVRPFNTFGPRQSARAIVPTIISQCLWGEHIRLGSTHPTRDLTFVDDTVAGFLAAGSAPHVAGRTINLGTGREVSIGDLASTIMGLVGRDLPLDRDDARVRPVASEVDRLLADPALAAELLGWRAETSLEDGLHRTIEWIREHRERYRVGVYHV